MTKTTPLGIYKLKDYILLHEEGTKYSLFKEGVEPYKQIDEAGHSSSSFEILHDDADYYIVHCPILCKSFNIQIMKRDFEEVNIQNSVELYSFLDLLDNHHHKETIFSVRRKIRKILNIKEI